MSIRTATTWRLITDGSPESLRIVSAETGEMLPLLIDKITIEWRPSSFPLIQIVGADGLIRTGVLKATGAEAALEFDTTANMAHVMVGRYPRTWSRERVAAEYERVAQQHPNVMFIGADVAELTIGEAEGAAL